MKIVFFYQGLSIQGFSSRQKPLGGTESALIETARALNERGHDVFVFTETEDEGDYAGVHYRHWKRFEVEMPELKADAFISIRSLLPLLARRWAPIQVYFSPDAVDQPFVNRALLLRFQSERSEQEYEVGLYSLKFVQKFIDAVVCVGHWQAETFSKQFHIAPEKIHVVPNGVWLPDFNLQPLAKRKRQIVYTSTPFRGLEYLLEYFPKIREKVADATCAVMSGMQVYGASDNEDQKQFHHIYEKARQPGVTLHGPLQKSKMAKILCESRVLAYPNTFAETFCIAALEGQAAGLPVVTTSLAALKERVASGEDGFLIEGHPSHPNYQKDFIEKTVELLKNDRLWSQQSRKARAKAEIFSYHTVALQWEWVVEKIMSQEVKTESPPFQPKDETLRIMVSGVPKEMKLKGDVIRRHIALSLKQSGFPESSLQYDGWK